MWQRSLCSENRVIVIVAVTGTLIVIAIVTVTDFWLLYNSCIPKTGFRAPPHETQESANS